MQAVYLAGRRNPSPMAAKGHAPGVGKHASPCSVKPCSKCVVTAGSFTPVTFTKTIKWSLPVLALGQSLAAADLSAVGPAKAHDLAARVVILANARSLDSIRLAEFYAEKRGVPAANIVTLPLPEAESITWREFIDQVYQPVQDELYRRGWIEGMATSLLDRLGRKRYALYGPGCPTSSSAVACRCGSTTTPRCSASRPQGKSPISSTRTRPRWTRS